VMVDGQAQVVYAPNYWGMAISIILTLLILWWLCWLLTRNSEINND
jgi:hypothetical protein